MQTTDIETTWSPAQVTTDDRAAEPALPPEVEALLAACRRLAPLVEATDLTSDGIFMHHAPPAVMAWARRTGDATWYPASGTCHPFVVWRMVVEGVVVKVFDRRGALL